MFDTVAISVSTMLPFDVDRLVISGAKIIYHAYTGEPCKALINGPNGSKEPRITVSRRNGMPTLIRAEVSIGEWLFGSNLCLPNDDDIFRFLETLSIYVEDKTGMPFDAYNGRVARLDILKDYVIQEENISRIVNEAKQISIAKYNTIPVNSSSVRWDNAGQKLTKRYQLYSKRQHAVDIKGSQGLVVRSTNVLRFEVQHRTNAAVNNLANSLKLPDHTAKFMLTSNVAHQVLEQSLKRLKIERLLTSLPNGLDTLFNTHGPVMGQRLVCHLALRTKYGSDYYRLQSFAHHSARTCKKYDRMCSDAGLFSLE